MSKRHRIGAACPNYRGGKRVASTGYVVLSSKEHGENQGRYEHRVVMEQHLGRPLRPDELVHHRNGDKTDNRLENLELTTRTEHPRIHGKGQELVCVSCGKRRWYSPCHIARSAGADFRCGGCAKSATDYQRQCRRCGAAFLGKRNAYLCGGCTRKRPGRTQSRP